MVKRVAILGSTGSIGRSALEVISSLRGEVEVVGLAAGRNDELLAAQVREFRPAVAAIREEKKAASLRDALAAEGVEVLAGEEAAATVATMPAADLVISAMVGFAGLAPTLAALAAGKDVALANKESLVAAGPLVREAQRRAGARIFPLDSEHAALGQCLEGRGADDVKRLILTASGGPFWRKSPADVANATPTEALAHPVWRMGEKISVDSATMMNKALEVIEAHWLFDVPWERIDVLVHPQSVVHALVEMADGTYVAQLAAADMRLPIQYALTYPRRRGARFAAASLDLAALGRLEFAELKPDRFPCFDLALAAGRRGGVRPAIMNAANEVAVEEFLAGELPFGAIADVIAAVLADAPGDDVLVYEDVAAADRWARRRAADAALAAAGAGRKC